MRFHYNNIMKRALIVFSMMFGLLFAVATGLVWYLGHSLKAGLIVAVITVLLQYICGPFIISMIYNIEFVPYLPRRLMEPEVLEFISKVCSDNNMPIPEIGFIKDGNPNAFVYGHFKKDARLIITTGLLNILDVEEQKSVIAHELGHIKNNDFIVMTIISLIPLVMYQIYAWSDRGSKGSIAHLVGLGAYGAYILSQYLVLSFSRIREYLADNFSKEVMGTEEPLKSALVKIAFGLTKYQKSKKLRASALGISDATQSESFFLLNYNNKDKDEECYKRLIAWDTKSVWGNWYELNSTHPLTAKRILALSEDTMEVSKPRIKEYMHFAMEGFIKMLPWAIFATMVIPSIINFKVQNIVELSWITIQRQPLYLLAYGGSLLLSYYYSYRKDFEGYSIKELLLREDASPVKGIPAVIEGKIIGKGIPGLFFSEDIVLDDGTGIIVVDYRQPLKILEFIFGLLAVDKIKGENAKVIGWYMRGNRPYFVSKEIIVEDKKYMSYVYALKKVFGYACIITGVVLYALMLFK